MAEHDGLTFAPVLVEDLDAVFGLHVPMGCLPLLELSSLAEIEIKVVRLGRPLAAMT